MNRIIQFFCNKFLRKYYRNKEMVSYWKKQDSVTAKVTTAPGGHYVMYMEGEKYPFPGFPRGRLLFGSLSPLKHNVKNKIFNDTWKDLEDGVDEKKIISKLKTKVLPEIFELADRTKYDRVPFERLVPVVKELHRAFTVVEQETGNKNVGKLRDIICFVLQEDDAYRFRFQWMARFFNPNSLVRILLRRDPIKDFEFALTMLEYGEMIGDMKERIRLLRRILLFVLKDEGVRKCFDLFIHELDWKKLRLSKADKYFFRAKYFKVDFPEYQY